MRVLHLEDSVEDADLVARQLNTSVWPRYEIQTVATLHSYLEALDHGEFDLILSDYTLGGFDGLSALEMAKKRYPDIPFIFLSGTIGEERAVEALKRGATDYVLKDRPIRLIPAMRQALAHAEESRKLKQTEEALRQNRERFRQIAENVADLIQMVDVKGRCLYRNPAYAEVVGGASDRTGTDAFSDIHPADFERVHAAFEEAVKSGQGVRMEYRLDCHNGTVRYVEAHDSVIRDAEGRVVYVLMVVRDVTERLATEQRIREQAALLDQAQDAILVRDLSDRITFWNRGAERIYGWSSNEAVGRHAKELWHEDSVRHKAAHAATLSEGEWMGELRQWTKTNDDMVVQSRWTLMKNASGAPVSFLVINTDITERKRLESQFLRVQRTEGIGMLAGGVAHDINNALVPILTSAELLKSMVGPGEALNYVSMIETSAHHGAALVRQLLAFAKGADGQRTKLALRPLLQDFVRFLAQTFPKEVKLEVQFRQEPWEILGDAIQLEQVLLNLCINSRDAMPDGGSITIDIGNVILDESAARRLHEVRPGPYVMIRVTDTGNGIAPEIIDKIFDPFFTTKEFGKGTGLGLSTVRGILKGHAGTISVDSEMARGTTFRIYLPALTEPTRRDSGSPLPPLASQKNEGILLVDDEPAIREVLGELLSAHGYRVYKAAGISEALIIIGANQSQINLVLTDIMLGEENGIDLIKKLRGTHPKLRYLAMSGVAHAGDYDEIMHSLGVVLLPKPLRGEVVMAAVRSALESRQSI